MSKPVAHIYAIRNTETKRIYIGITKNSIAIRFSAHMSSLADTIRKGTKYVNKKMLADFIKYGKKSFTVELVEEIYDADELRDIEQYWIDKVSEKYDCYNSKKSGYSKKVVMDGRRYGTYYLKPVIQVEAE